MIKSVLIAVSMIVALPLLAEDPLLTEEFFESPAGEPSPEDKQFETDIDRFLGTEPQAPAAPVQKPREPWFERHSFSGGIGIGNGSFSLTATLRSHFNRYLALETTAYYIRESGDLNDKPYSLEFYGPESSIVAEYPVVKLITPFAGIGAGYEFWSQLYDEFEFDKSNSLTAILQVGTNINMTENLILQLRHFTRVYLLDQPLELKDRQTKKDQAVSQFQVNFLLRF